MVEINIKEKQNTDSYQKALDIIAEKNLEGFNRALKNEALLNANWQDKKGFWLKDKKSKGQAHWMLAARIPMEVRNALIRKYGMEMYKDPQGWREIMQKEEMHPFLTIPASQIPKF